MTGPTGCTGITGPAGPPFLDGFAGGLTGSTSTLAVSVPANSSIVVAPFSVLTPGDWTDGKFNVQTGFYLVPNAGRYNITATIYLSGSVSSAFQTSAIFKLMLGSGSLPNPASDTILLQTTPPLVQVISGLVTISVSNLGTCLAGNLNLNANQILYLAITNSSASAISATLGADQGQTVFTAHRFD